MHLKSIVQLALFSALIAVIVVIVLKMLNYSGSTVVAGAAIAGGITGALSTSTLKRKS